VYGWDTLVLLKHYLESGLSKPAIARQLGVSRRVIYHWITTGQLDREVTETAAPRCRAPRRRNELRRNYSQRRQMQDRSQCALEPVAEPETEKGPSADARNWILQVLGPNPDM
jgi:transposase-like protein